MRFWSSEIVAPRLMNQPSSSKDDDGILFPLSFRCKVSTGNWPNGRGKNWFFGANGLSCPPEVSVSSPRKKNRSGDRDDPLKVRYIGSQTRKKNPEPKRSNVCWPRWSPVAIWVDSLAWPGQACRVEHNEPSSFKGEWNSWVKKSSSLAKKKQHFIYNNKVCKPLKTQHGPGLAPIPRKKTFKKILSNVSPLSPDNDD